MENHSTDELLIYASPVTPRVSYMVDILFSGRALLTDSKEKMLTYEGAKINYSPEKFTDTAFWIVPHGLLSNVGITAQVLDCFEWEGLPVFFRTGGDIPFDIFSASFYLLSRYEEYLPYEPDKYGRYAHTNSIAYKEGFLQLPLVNIWMQAFDQHSKLIPSLTKQHSTFVFTPTYDIDIAYAYRYQPLWKNVLGFYRDLLLGKTEQVIERGNVYSGRKNDPFDTYDWLDALHEKYALHPVYFFLTVIKRGVHDKNLSANARSLQRLYKRIAEKYVTGLHPSWQSGTDEGLLLKEKQILQKIIKKPVVLSRNHYLRFTVPHTYRRLMAAGITDDYSMAYGTINGFRASYALPFYWYDLKKESVTELVIHPFCFMEANSFFEQGYSAQEAGEEMQYYHDIVKKVNGELITLFHNHFLTEQPQWVEWRNMYEKFLQKNFSGSHAISIRN